MSVEEAISALMPNYPTEQEEVADYLVQNLQGKYRESEIREAWGRILSSPGLRRKNDILRINED